MTRSLLLVSLALAACTSTAPVAQNDAFVPPIDAGHDAAPTVDVGHDAFMRSDANTDANVDCSPHTFVVTSDGASYTIDGVDADPTITLCRFVTYTFDLSGVVGHHPIRLTAGPFPVLDVAAGGTGTLTIGAEGPDPDHYECSIHFFGGDVVVVD